MLPAEDSNWIADATIRSPVGGAVFAVYAAIAVAGVLVLSWVLSDPPHPVVLLVAFVTVVLGSAYFGYRTGLVRLAASLDATELPEHRAPELYRRLYRLIPTVVNVYR